MKTTRSVPPRSLLTLLAFCLLPSAFCLGASPLGTAFNYQGRLGVGTNAAAGIFDLRFTLYDVASGPAQITSTLTNAATPVTNGLFTVALDFGPGVFNGEARWLEIAVRTNGGGAFTALSPRQPLTPSPYALYAPSAGNSALLNGQSPTAYAPATGSTAYVAKAGDTMTGPLVVPANGLRASTNQLVLSGGNVGIGTASPAYQLTVTDRAYIRGQRDSGYGLLIRGNSIETPDRNLDTDEIAINYYGYNSGPGSFRNFGVYNGKGGSVLYARGSDGNVGIGTASPTAKLDVAGTVKATALEVGQGHTLSGTLSTVTGGRGNTASGEFSTAAGGVNNNASGLASFAVGTNTLASGYGAVAMGVNTKATDYAATAMGYATTASGVFSTAMGDTTTASGFHSTAMGKWTTASGDYSTAMGHATTASGGYSTAMGYATTASGWSSTAMGCVTIAGSAFSTALGYYSACTNDYTLVAGRQAKAIHQGAFVWADSQAADFFSTGVNQVSFRCAGGVRLTSGSGAVNQTVSWAPGSASWSFTSDRNTKESFQPVDGKAVLEKVAQLPITEWNYQGYAQRHIGPMAQDFHAQFPLNESDTTLNSADLDGVALAAIQGLNQKLEEKNATLEKEMAELKAVVKSLAQKVNGGGQ